MHLLLASVSSATSPAGVCRHAANIARGMAANPSVRKITMLIGEWQAAYFREAFHLEADNLEIQTVSIANNSVARNYWYLRTLPALARASGADILHLAYPMPVLRCGVPTVVSLHDLYPFDIPRNFGRRRAWFNRTALRLCLKNTDAVACVSEPTRKRVHQLFPALNPSKTSVVPNSVSLSNSSPDAPLPEALRDHPFLLCVAQHRANKNLPLLLRAFHLALEQHAIRPNMKLVIVGNEGPETPALQRAVAELHLSNHVLFLRDISDAVLATLYANCEIFIAPSLIEGFGLPLAEALAAGCRIVCSDIPAFRSLASNHCTFFDPTDSIGASLLTALPQALKTPRRKPISHPGLDPQKAAAMYVALYTQLTMQGLMTLLNPSPAGLRTSGDL